MAVPGKLLPWQVFLLTKQNLGSQGQVWALGFFVLVLFRFVFCLGFLFFGFFLWVLFVRVRGDFCYCLLWFILFCLFFFFFACD